MLFLIVGTRTEDETQEALEDVCGAYAQIQTGAFIVSFEGDVDALCKAVGFDQYIENPRVGMVFPLSTYNIGAGGNYYASAVDDMKKVISHERAVTRPAKADGRQLQLD